MQLPPVRGSPLLAQPPIWAKAVSFVNGRRQRPSVTHAAVSKVLIRPPYNLGLNLRVIGSLGASTCLQSTTLCCPRCGVAILGALTGIAVSHRRRHIASRPRL